MFRRIAAALLPSLALAVAGLPSVAPAALSGAAGGAGGKGKGAYGARTGRSINNYRLIGDPTPGAGSATVEYDVNAVHIQAVFNEAGYQIDATHSFLGLQNSTPLVESIADDATQDGARGYEAGYVQVTWTPSAGAAAGAQFYQPKFLSQAVVSESFQPDSAYSAIGSGGDTTGAVPFGLDFLPVGSSPGQTYVTIYANTQSDTVQNPGTGVPDASSPDTLTASDGSTVTADEITPATAPLPEPSGPAVLALGIAAAVGRRRTAVRRPHAAGPPSPR